MTQLTRDQVNTILKNAPKGTSTQVILDGLISRGYDIEGVDSNAVREKLNQPNKLEQVTQQQSPEQQMSDMGVTKQADGTYKAPGVGKALVETSKGVLKGLAETVRWAGEQLGKSGLPKAPGVADLQKQMGLNYSTEATNQAQQGGKIAEKVGEFLVPIGWEAAQGKLVSGIKSTVQNVKNLFKGKASSVEDVVGRITQETNPYKLKQANGAFADIDTSNIKTFKDASTVLGDSAKVDLATVDARYASSSKLLKPADVTISSKGGGEVNYVQESIDGLKELYVKTKEAPKVIAKIVELETKFKTTGLTPKEINDLAKQYGTEFGSKAFSKTTGEPLTSVNAQAYENVRTGVKESARSTMPDDVTRNLDKMASKKIETQKMMNDLDESAQQATNKLKQTGALQKFGANVARVVDFISQGSVKGFLKQMGLGMPQAKFDDYLELQTQLQKNLSLLNKINNATPEQLNVLMNDSNFINSLLGLYTAEAVKGSNK